MSNKVTTPYPLFSDIDGSPLNAGFLFLGESEKDAEQFPIVAYWDEAKTQIVEQPVSTRNGFIVKDNLPAKIFIEEESCSITIKNQSGTLIQKVESYDQLSTVKGVKGLINAEKSRAEAAEVALDTKINTETARATAAEAVIDAKVNANGVGNRAYKTYADMDADKANIPAKSKVTVTNDSTSSNNGDWQWDGTAFTKSAYDPLQQAKNYADANPLFKPGVLTASDNLNNMRTEGYFKPTVNVPSLALNYPVVALGELHVRQITGNVCVQTYWVYGTFGQWIRTTDGSGNWNAWEQIGTKSVIDTWIQTGKNPINLTTNNNIDLNTLTTTSTYAVFSSNPVSSSNFPEPSVQGFVLVNTLTTVTSQLFIVRGQNKIYVRALWGTNGWTPWELLATTTYVNTKIDSAIAALNLAKYDNLTYFNTLDSLLRDPLKSVRIKFIGDSITWGLADVNDPDSLPRTGQLTDPRKTTAFTTKIWVNLFRQWVARVYGNNAITQDRPGSAYTTKDMLTGWQSIYKKVNMIDKNGTVLIDSVKLSILSYNTAVKSGYAVNFPSPTFNTTLKPVEMSLEVYGDNLTIQYKKWNSGDSNDNVEVYVDGVLNSSFNYFDASNTTYDVEHTVEFPYGLHTIRIVNKATNANSYTQLSGFRVNKKIWVINEGIIGSSTKSWLDNSLYEGTLDGKDDVVIPMLGTNDRGQEGGIDGFRKRLNDNIDKINTLSPSSKVILMSSTFAQVDAPSSPYKFDMATVDKIIGDTARERNLMFISNYKACAQARIDAEVIWSDGLHLNDRGNQLYYENVKNKLFTY